MTNTSKHESWVASTAESIAPDLIRILENAPAYGSCGMDLCFHDLKIVHVILKAEISKLSPMGKTDDH
jgi:hypothetical protein